MRDRVGRRGRANAESVFWGIIINSTPLYTVPANNIYRYTEILIMPARETEQPGAGRGCTAPDRAFDRGVQQRAELACVCVCSSTVESQSAVLDAHRTLSRDDR